MKSYRADIERVVICQRKVTVEAEVVEDEGVEDEGVEEGGNQTLIAVLTVALIMAILMHT